MTVNLVVFDAYGTLFDVTGAARAAAEGPGGKALADRWPRLAADWRQKQLEYTWLRRIMGDHADFATVTAEALDWAMAAQGLADAALRSRLLALYDKLPAFPEVTDVLAALWARELPAAILSNGTPAMLSATVQAAGLTSLIDRVISVEEAGLYKPDAAVYDLVRRHYRRTPDQVLFVSANGWDVAGAARFGFVTLWVNRSAAPIERLPYLPTHVRPDLSGLPDLLEMLE